MHRSLVLSLLALSLFLVLPAWDSPATDGDDDAAVDADGDGVLVGEDCDDADPSSTIVADDMDCDGDLDITDCAPDDPLIYTGAPETLGDGLDQDCDGGDDVVCEGDYEIIPGSAHSMSDVEYCAAVTGNLSIAFNPALTNLDGLSNLNSARSLSISENDALTNLDGLSNLNSLDFLYISDNNALTNLDGLSNLNSLGGGLSITYNAALCQDSVDALLARCTVSGAVRTENNDGGCP